MLHAVCAPLIFHLRIGRQVGGKETAANDTCKQPTARLGSIDANAKTDRQTQRPRDTEKLTEIQ